MIQYFTRTIIAISVIVIAILFGRQKLERHRGRAYGDAFEQMQQLKVPAVHRAGIVGHGVRIGVIDSGFDRSHPALRSTQVRAEFDFIDNDSSTGQSARLNRHGTQVWSILAANDPGQMIGVAPEAEYVLAQAECEGESRTDCAREEKATIAAIDWLCDQQVDLITFSLCLLQREPPRRYLPQQMDGRSAPVTRRADQAFEQGVLFFAAAGNGFRRDWRIIEPPADGFRVVAVGGVEPSGKVAPFSAAGPTADGRCKPDLCAPGTNLCAARSGAGNGGLPYTRSSGTSLSAPAVAGIAALILSAHPDLSADQVVQALKETADQAREPDNRRGWGQVNALRAVSYWGPAFSNLPEISEEKNEICIETSVLSSVGIEGRSVCLQVTDASGLVCESLPMVYAGKNRYRVVLPASAMDDTVRFRFTARDKNGRETLYPGTKRGGYFCYTPHTGKVTDALKRPITPIDTNLSS